MYTGICAKFLLFMLGLNKSLNFLNRVLTNTQKSNSMKIRPVGAELFHLIIFHMITAIQTNSQYYIKIFEE